MGCHGYSGMTLESEKLAFFMLFPKTHDGEKSELNGDLIYSVGG